MKRHLFHLVSPSPWPIVSSIGAFFLTSGLAFYMHRVLAGGFLLCIGFLLVIFTAFLWFKDVTEEASAVGSHTRVVRVGITLGFYLFIVSEVMLFFGFFWAFFHSSLSPDIIFATVWPPVGISTIRVVEFPFFNTLLLIFSGFAIT